MVNPRTIGSAFTKQESKDLLDKAQILIDEKIKGPKLKKKKEPKTEADSVYNQELSVEKSLEPKNLKTPPKVSVDKAEKMLFTKENKIKPTKLIDFNITKFDTRDDILKFIDEVSVQFKTSIDKQKRGVQTNRSHKRNGSITSG
jgi:hypothetical protein